jgi:hypothetical protein
MLRKLTPRDHPLKEREEITRARRRSPLGNPHGEEALLWKRTPASQEWLAEK